MTDPLAGIVAKLNRGDHHLERLMTERAAFLYDQPWEIAFKQEHHVGWQWFLATFEIKRDPPAEWSIRVGEAVHQYRAGLDHLMTQLVWLRHPGVRADRTSNFPILPEPGSFWSTTATGRSPADSIRADVLPHHFAALERLQPKSVKRPRGQRGMSVHYALALLKWLDDMDKHALVRPSFIGPERVTLHTYWHGGDNVELENTKWEQLYEPFVDPLEHGTKLYRAQLVHGPRMSVPMTIEPDVNFGSPPAFPWVTLDSVRTSFDWVRRIITRFRRITPEFRASRDIARP